MTVFAEPKTPLLDLESTVEAHKGQYDEATPFPHCCFDNLVDDGLLRSVVGEFPSKSDSDWRRLETPGNSHKKSITANFEHQLGPATQYLIRALSAPVFLRFLEQLTGINGLICDPYLHGGALHEIETGGFLGLHTDFNWQPHLKLYRRLNLLLYLNPDWKEEYGGHLELWDENMVVGKRFLPVWNRMIISSVTAKAFHGFPHAIACPPSMSRRSLAMWYYTAELPALQRMDYYFHEPDWMECSTKDRPVWKNALLHLLPPVLTQLKKKSVQTSENVPLKFLPPLLSYPILRWRAK